MARPKKQPKIKEPIRLRSKTLANGNNSLYLDMYKDGRREYLFLRLYLIPETDQSARTANQNTLQVANAIKAQKIVELTNSNAGLTSATVRSKIKLADWIEQYVGIVRKRQPGSSYYRNLYTLKRHLHDYSPDVTLGNIDRKYCEGLIEYLKNLDTAKGTKMSGSSVWVYVHTFCIVINAAVREGMMAANPMKSVDPKKKPRGEGAMREYLTVDELNILMVAPAKKSDIKLAFLFSCFCGLRLSDIEALTWGCIAEEGGHLAARIIVKKTRQPLYVPLSAEALRWLPERGGASDTDRVFALGGRATVHRQVKAWTEASGIKKHVSFHVARHTFYTSTLLDLVG